MTDQPTTPIAPSPGSEAPATPVDQPEQTPPLAGAASATPEVAPPPANAIHWGTGRRKSSVARVRLIPGSGNVLVNERPVEQYFSEPQDRLDVVAPLEITGVRKYWDVRVNVNGGGHTGQAGAIRLGMARAVVKAYSQHEGALRDAGFLTRDSRIVERKKYGQRKARRRFQFSKR